MKRYFPFLITITIITLSSNYAHAQLQFCFGASPGFSQVFPMNPAQGVTIFPKLSLTLQAGANYSFNRAISTMFLLSYSHYNSSPHPTWEGEIDGAYNYAVSKLMRIKSGLGIGAAFLHNTTDNEAGNNVHGTEVFQYDQDNLFLILKSGLQWKAPGKYHSVLFGLDYHWGFKRAHQAYIYEANNSHEVVKLSGRGSYLALNMLIIIGKEKYKWKKPLTAKDKLTKKKAFVM